MGPAIVIIFWLITAAIFGGTWLVCLALYIVGRKYKRPIMSRLGLVPLVMMTFLAMTLGPIIVCGIVRSCIPGYVFADTFHEQPTAEVSEIESDVFGFADSLHVFLQFKASRKTYERLCPDRLKPLSYSEYRDDLPGTNLTPPKWWHEPSPSVSQFRMFHPKWGVGRRFAAETEYMTYDQSNQTVQYFYLGID